MHMFKKMAVAAALVAASAAASADQYFLQFTGADQAGTDIALTFQGQSGTVNAFLVNFGGLTSVSLDNVAFLPSNLGWVLTNTNFSGANHVLKTVGTGPIIGTLTYNTTAITTPGTPVASVPEPESYAMFLAGLGLLGAVARRRKQA